MTKRVTLRKMGGSVGVTLPKELADRLHVKEGDELFVVETDKGGPLGVAAGDVDEPALATWVRSAIAPLSSKKGV